MIIRKMAAFGRGGLIDIMSQTERWWREQMIRQGHDSANISGEPVRVEKTVVDGDGWPPDDRYPKTPWRGMAPP